MQNARTVTDDHTLRKSGHDVQLREKGKAATVAFQKKFANVSTHIYKAVLETGVVQVDDKIRPQQYVMALRNFSDVLLQRAYCACGWHCLVAHVRLRVFPGY